MTINLSMRVAVPRLTMWPLVVFGASCLGSLAEAQRAGSPPPPSPEAALFAPAAVCSIDAALQDYQVVGGLPLQLYASWLMPGSMARNGTFAARVDFASVPNQGIVVGDASGVSIVARGCWPGAGCGDPTPIGGTFSVMPQGGEHVPVVNSRGDVLFLSDVDGGSSSRGLFFFERSTQSIHKVCAIGDPTPYGGNFGSVGWGSLNDHGEVAFLAWRNFEDDIQILRWNSGVLTPVAVVGGAGPNGMIFARLVYQLVGPVPAIPCRPPHIRNDGHVFFVGSVEFAWKTAVIEEHGGQFTVHAITYDPVPGGQLGWIDPPIPNESGDLAFTAASGPTGAKTWFRGRTNQWERVLGIGDFIAGKRVVGMTGSVGPFCTPFHDGGSLLLTVILQDPVTFSQKWALTLHRPGQPTDVLLSIGDQTPLGPITQLTAYPPISTTSEALVGVEVSTPSGLVDAHLKIQICVPPGPQSYCTAKTNSQGCLPQISAQGIPSASSPTGFVVRAAPVLNSKPGLLLYSFSGQAAIQFAGGTLCLASPIRRSPVVFSNGSPPPALDCSGEFTLDMNTFAANSPGSALGVPGTVVNCQWYGRDPGFAAPLNVQLTNAVEYTVNP